MVNFMPLMKAIVVKASGGDFELVEKEIPEPGEHEVLLKVQACGVCHGDAIVKEGYFPGLSIRERQVTRLLELLLSWVLSRIIGRLDKGLALAGGEGTASL